MEKDFRIGFLGAGKMAEALIAAILKSRITPPHRIICGDPVEERLIYMKEKYRINTTPENAVVLQNADMVILAFKPQNFPAALEGLTGLVRPDHLVVSIMAGIRLSRIRQYLPARLVRVMPNTACLVGEMAAGYAVSDNVTGADLEKVRAILAAAGEAVEVDESQLDAVTGLSGSGPAFVAYLIESFIQAGVAEGLSPPTARTLALKTFAGTARLLAEWDMPPHTLIDMVSSPNGTTVAGRTVLETSDVREILINTVKRAAERSRELG